MCHRGVAGIDIPTEGRDTVQRLGVGGIERMRVDVSRAIVKMIV